MNSFFPLHFHVPKPNTLIHQNKMSYYINNANDMTCIPLTQGLLGQMVSNVSEKILNMSTETIIAFIFVMITFSFVMLFKINMLIIDEMSNKIQILNKEIEMKNQKIEELAKNNVVSEKIKCN